MKNVKQITVITGYGYIAKSGTIISKAQLPAGVFEIADDLDYIEVADKAAYDAVEESMSEERELEIAIADESRKLAIVSLQAKGILPQDFVDVKAGRL